MIEDNSLGKIVRLWHSIIPQPINFKFVPRCYVTLFYILRITHNRNDLIAEWIKACSLQQYYVFPSHPFDKENEMFLVYYHIHNIKF